MIAFREGTRADRDAILELRAIAFPDQDPEKRYRRFWNWEFAHGRFFLAEDNGRIVGHFGFVPQRYVAERDIHGALAVDVMTHPAYRRQRVFSQLAAFAANTLKDEFEVITAYQIRSAVLPGMAAGGWRPAQRNPVLLKPLILARAVRDASRIRELTESDFDQVDVLLETNAPRQPRTPEFLHWRYLENPLWAYRLNGWFEDGVLRAFLIDRDALLRGTRTLAILDAGGDRDAVRELVRHACRGARERRIRLAAALMSRVHPAYVALRRSGFFPGPHRFRLLLQVFDDSLARLESEPWSLSWGDTDHL